MEVPRCHLSAHPILTTTTNRQSCRPWTHGPRCRPVAGKLFGQWPGLAAGQLDEGDLAITTDYRAVVTEIMTTLRPGSSATSLFPGFATPSPLGLIA
ncbi:MAG: hypothetical protein IPG25_13110 [Proteobacteria bacterium]|nr:hypothetical protein [Pseudomonadota bacterium]